MNQHDELLVHGLSRTFKRVLIRYQAAGGAPFSADKDLRVDISIERVGLRTSPKYRIKAIPLNLTHENLQAEINVQAGSADRDGADAFNSEGRTRNHHARPGNIPLTRVSANLSPLR